VLKIRKAAMMIELPEKLEAALKVHANAHGVSPAGYVCEVLERDLASSLVSQPSGDPFKTGRGMFAKYGQAPSGGGNRRQSRRYVPELR
jgi:plasmid stability protein